MSIRNTRLAPLVTIGILGLLILSVNAFAEPKLYLERSQLQQDESLELILDGEPSFSFETPDFSPLTSDFELQAPRPIERHNAKIGWQVTLYPRRTGVLSIPPLSWGTWHSPASSVEVLATETTPQPPSAEPVFLRAQLESTEVYVQECTLLRLQLYHSIPLYDDAQFHVPALPQAEVQPLGGPITYEKNTQGKRYGVVEQRYAICPQQSGVLNIPSISFQASQPETGTSGASKYLQRQSPQLSLRVRPIPAQYPAHTPWIAARALSLTEHWSNPPEQSIAIGSSLTHRILIRAEGVFGAQIPPLVISQHAGLRRYADQAKVADEIDSKNLVGVREQREVLIPTQSGLFNLEGLELYWWNTQSDRLEHLVHPGVQLQVLAEKQATETEPATFASSTAAMPAPCDNYARVSERTLEVWPLISALLGVTTVLGFGLWWRARRQPAILVRSGSANTPTERSLLEDLRRACLANNPQNTRQALDAWARQQPETLAEMAARFIPLSDALDGLNGALYGAEEQPWQGESLWEAISRLPPLNHEDGPPQHGSTLPPLYPH